jgi:hypothetical protein
MQASIKTSRDGSVNVWLDTEAARAMFASVLFAARFHDGIAPLAKIAEEGLGSERRPVVRRPDPCQ